MNDTNAKNAILTDYAKKLIRVKAHQLCRRPGFRSDEREDLEQEFWLALVSHEDRLDLRRASRDTFSDRVVSSAAGMARRERQRHKRARGFHLQSLDEVPSGECGEAAPLAANVTQDDLDRRAAKKTRDDVAGREDVEAVANALENMPPEERDVCRRIMGGSISSAARDRNISRRQVRKALAVARPVLEQAGFGGT